MFSDCFSLKLLVNFWMTQRRLKRGSCARHAIWIRIPLPWKQQNKTCYEFMRLCRFEVFLSRVIDAGEQQLRQTDLGELFTPLHLISDTQARLVWVTFTFTEVHIILQWGTFFLCVDSFFFELIKNKTKITMSRSLRWRLQISCFVWPTVRNSKIFSLQSFKTCLEELKTDDLTVFLFSSLISSSGLLLLFNGGY